jgi:hypothetical protein
MVSRISVETVPAEKRLEEEHLKSALVDGLPDPVEGLLRFAQGIVNCGDREGRDVLSGVLAREQPIELVSAVEIIDGPGSCRAR